jgi:hypothetical protein
MKLLVMQFPPISRHFISHQPMKPNHVALHASRAVLRTLVTTFRSNGACFLCSRLQFPTPYVLHFPTLYLLSNLPLPERLAAIAGEPVYPPKTSSETTSPSTFYLTSLLPIKFSFLHYSPFHFPSLSSFLSFTFYASNG